MKPVAAGTEEGEGRGKNGEAREQDPR